MSGPVRSVRALVAAGFGLNCEEETAEGLRLAGAEARIVHLSELFAGRVALADFRIVVLPGGFSFGDDLGSGKVLANELRFRKVGQEGGTLLDALRRFLASGGHVLGICNGFQVLARLGLVPNVGGACEQEVTLARNDSGRFEDRWCEVAEVFGARSPVVHGLGRLRLPVRHAEGKLLIRDEAVRRAVLERGLCCLRYCDERGEPARRYPEDPNGSELSCAALCDPTGQVFGLMPHPEAALSLYNDPAWPQIVRRDGAQAAKDEGQGLALLRNLVRHAAEGRPP